MRSTLSLTCVLLATACAGGSAPPAGLSAEDVAAIKRTERNWVQAMLAGDWSAGAAIHTLDAVRMPPNAPDVRGRAAILTALPQYGKPTAFTLESPEIDGRGDLAYAWERVSYTSSKLAITGRALVIFRKQTDGSWLADRVIWNSDQPMPK